MSAYLVDLDHIRYLITSAARLTRRDHESSFRYFWPARATWCTMTLSITDRTKAGQILWDENRRSVAQRYGEEPEPEPYTDEPHPEPLDPVQVLKSIACLDYQSCETDDWQETEAHAFLAALKEKAIRALPGWEEAAWGAPPILEGSRLL